MAISVVQFVTGGGTGTSIPVTISATTAGNLLVVCAAGQSDPISVTSTAGTFTNVIDTAYINNPPTFGMNCYYAQNIASGATTVTVGFYLSTTATIFVYELAGASLTAPVDLGAILSQTAAPVSPSVTPGAAGAALIATIEPTSDLTNGSGCVDAPWTGNYTASYNKAGSAYYLNPALSSQHAVFEPTTSQQTVSSVASFTPTPTQTTKIKLVQTVVGGSNGSPSTITIRPSTAGNLLVVAINGEHSGTTTSVTDNATGGSNTWVQTPNPAIGIYGNSDIWYVPNCKAGATTITVAYTWSYITATVFEFSGVKKSNPLDSSAALLANVAASPTSPVMTPTATDELVITSFGAFDVQITGVDPAWHSPGRGVYSHSISAYVINPAVSSQQTNFLPSTAQRFGSAGVVFFAEGTPVAITQVQSQFHESGAATSNAVTVTATTAGNLLVVGLAFPHFTGTATSVTDNATGGSNTYTHATTAQVNDGNNQSDIWYCENCKAGATTVTVNLPSSVASVISVDEYSGVKTASSFDLGTTNSSASGACVGPSQTPSAAGELLYTVITTGARFLTGVSAPWTAGGHAVAQQGDVWAYYINAPLSAQQAAAIPNTASAFVSSGASFLAQPAGPPVISSGTDATAKEGVAFEYDITASNTPTTYAASPLPSWLSVDTNTGKITGTPPNTGDLPLITISATNAQGTGTGTVAIRVELNSGLFGANARKSDWFAKNGYPSNDLADQMSRWLAANGGGISNDLNTQWYTFLAGKGRTGSITDMYRAELLASLSLSANSSLSLSDLEGMFYSASGNTFA